MKFNFFDLLLPLFDVIANALRLERIDLIGLQHQTNWENMRDYERNIQVY